MLQTTEKLEFEWTAITADDPESIFIQEALEHIEVFQSHEHRVAGFEPSNYCAAAGVLRAIRQQGLNKGERFCEWGSGFGVVTCLAAMLGFDARGIEIEETLIGSAVQLAEDYGLDVQFHQGSYEADGLANRNVRNSAWSNPLANLLFDCDLIYIYPWPAEVALSQRLFAQFAQAGTLLVSYMGGENFRVQRRRNCDPV